MIRKIQATSTAACFALLLVACSDGESLVDRTSNFAGSSDDATSNTRIAVNHEILDRRVPAANANRDVFFGDLHVHTQYSFDAYSFGTTTSPYDAYRYAKGAPLQHPSGYEIQLREPLDFYAVTDHAMFLGVVKAAANPNTDVSQYETSKPIHNINAPDNMGLFSVAQRMRNFGGFIPGMLAGLDDGSVDPEVIERISKAAWEDTVNAADQFNDPGRFTTFAAYEYTSSSHDSGNLHRNVIFKGTATLPALPFSRFNSQNPEGLWDWMDGLRANGIESLAIPHNSNGSNGQMFKLEDWAGNPLDDDYAEQRMRNEPIVEITQVKGTSDTHPLLSPNDDWADFEIYPLRVGTSLPSQASGSYVREALMNGMEIAAKGGVNPYHFGLVGASDTHVSGNSDDEETYFSKAGVLDGTAVGRGSVPAPLGYELAARAFAPELLSNIEGRAYIQGAGISTWGASGIAAVWAEENTREAIFEAFRRKETFATTGPRIKLRFFSGYGLKESMSAATDPIAGAYAAAVPMGGDLSVQTEAVPEFFVWALADKLGAPLQRAQIVKGYMKEGKAHEKIYDVACSDGNTPDPSTHRCPDNGAKVNLDDCSITADVGNQELKTIWQDPEHSYDQDAFYYVRVLENPTCRWSTWDANRAGAEPRPDLAKTLQERAWSSPIWLKASGSE